MSDHKKYLKNGYFFDTNRQSKMNNESKKDDYKKKISFSKNMTSKSSHDLIEKRGLVLIKIPKTGTETFRHLVQKSFGFSKQGDISSNNILNNILCWKLWPNLYMLPRENNRSPWVVGGKTFMPEQLLIIEHHFSLSNPSVNLKNKSLGYHKFKMLMSHWPWRYDPSIYERIMISKTPFVVTILRDPARRALSSYFYNLTRRGINVSTATISEFELFIREKYDEDFYCRWFSYPQSANNPNYDNAIKNIQSEIDLVGITEKYQQFIEICNKKFGMFNQNVNVNKQKTPFSYSDLPNSVLKLLMEKTKKDRILYDVAVKRFEQDCNKYGV
jgi:hypothetical protein